MRTAVRVVIADDHAMVREGLVRILNSCAAVAIVAEASDGLDAVQQAQKHKPDIVITDLSMPRLNGLGVVQRIHAILPKCRILVLTVHHDEEYIVPIVEAGASGYLVKDSASAELCSAIQALANGGVYFGSEATKVLAEQLQRVDVAAEKSLADLTHREREVLLLIAASKKPAEIASALGIALKTVKNHRSHLLRKLGLRSDEELAKFAAQDGLLPGSPTSSVFDRQG